MADPPDDFSRRDWDSWRLTHSTTNKCRRPEVKVRAS